MYAVPIKVLLVLYLWIHLVAYASHIGAAEIPAGQMLSVRLIAPVTSDGSRPQDTVHAMLAAPLPVGDGMAIPARTELDGHVVASRSIGYGWRRERALLEIEFHSLTLEDGSCVAIRGVLVEIENARETVSRKGTISGTLATGAPQVVFNSRLRHLPVWNPYSDPILMIHKAVFPFFPQPEIRLPRGADLRVRVEAPFALPDEALMRIKESPAEMPVALEGKPARIRTLSGKESDVINVALVGTEEEVMQAFDAAGWNLSRKASIRSVLRGMRDVLEQYFDPHAPMSRMKWNGRSPDMQFQKSLNSYSKRHHIRVWRAGDMEDGTPLWVGAATHDIQLKFLWRKMHFTHGIASDIDAERQKVREDLAFSGCVESAHVVEREMPVEMHNSDRTPMFTDGAIDLLDLQQCRYDRIGTVEEHEALARADRPFLQRYLRRQVLILRNDLLRANVIYGIGDLSRRLVRSVVRWGHHRAAVEKRRGLARKAEIATAVR